MFAKRITSFAFAIRYIQGRNFRGSSTKSSTLNSHKIGNICPNYLFYLYVTEVNLFSIHCFEFDRKYRQLFFLGIPVQKNKIFD